MLPLVARCRPWGNSVPQMMQQSGYARSIVADDANGFVFLDLERNVFECPELAKVLLGCLPCPALQARGEKLLEPVARGVVDLVAFAEIGDAGWRCYRQSWPLTGRSHPGPLLRREKSLY